MQKVSNPAFSAIPGLAEKYHGEMIELRRHLHRNPEISFNEFRTTELLQEKLTKMGYAVERPLPTGCIAVMEGDIKSDRVIALRADIDALPMDEEGEAKESFKSKNPGAAHCCGHDAHTANLIGAAKIIADLKEHLSGKVVLIFQHAEERLPGGARQIVESGVLEKHGVQAVYGLHTSPRHEPGTIGIIKGRAMAMANEFSLDIIGKGGHAATPHLAADPIVMASQIVGAIQTIASRAVNPIEPVVVTIGKITGGTVNNIIPERVSMLGTIRTFNRETTELVSARIHDIAEGVSKAGGGTFEYNFIEGYPAVINDDWAIDVLAETGSALFGDQVLTQLPEPIMGGEDFAFYLEHYPGAFFLLGSGSKEADSQYAWHHPRYNVDEKCLKTGAAIMAGLAFHPEATPQKS